MIDKRGVIRVSGILFVVSVLLILILQVQIISSESRTENFKPVGVVEKRSDFGGGGGKLLKQIPIEEKESKEVIIDLRVETLLETQDEVFVNVDLKINTTSTSLPKGTKEERVYRLSKIREEVNNSLSEVVPFLSEDEFKLKRASLSYASFSGNITKKGFDKLKKDSRVKVIRLVETTQTSLVKSAELINIKNDVWNLGYTGEGQVVCVVDSGINYTHPALGGCSQTSNISDGSCDKVIGGYDFVNNDANPMDDLGHGTHIAGIVASTDSVYKGVAYDSRLVAVKVLNSGGGGSDDDLRDGIRWCIDNRDFYNISIITASINYGLRFSAICNSVGNDAVQAVNDARDEGLFVLVSSGNEGYNDGIRKPACAFGATSVGAVYDANLGREPDYPDYWTDANCFDAIAREDSVTCFTNRANNLNLLAPGCRIDSVNFTTGGFDYICGTSQAAPHVAGAVALLLEKNPSLTPDEIEQILNDTGESIYDNFNSRNNGDGSNLTFKRINVLAAIEAVDEGSTNGTGSSCNESGYDQCYEHSNGDCNVIIAVNYYTNINNISWGNISDSSDPYVIDNYTIGWKGIIARDIYYNVTDPNNDCEYGGCNTGDEIANTGTKKTVNAPGMAFTENVLGYNQTASSACWAWFNGFSPSYTNGTNPIYVLNCYNDDDCAVDRYCNKTGNWSEWDCVVEKVGGQNCTFDYECSSGFCDNDGLGLADDDWCFTPLNSYFDNQETNYCEYSTGNGSVDCDERIVGWDLNRCEGVSYYEEECSSNCSYTDATSIFECTDAGCSCIELLCDGLSVGDNITTCSAGQTYFADKCTSTASGEDRDNICRNASFVAGCTASDECNGIIAGTGNCDMSCDPSNAPTIPTMLLCDGTDCINNNTFMDNIEINCSGSNDSEDDDITYFVYAKYNQTSESEEIINSFNNSLTAENLSFTGREIITRYLEIPKNASVVNATINLTGYREAGDLNKHKYEWFVENDSDYHYVNSNDWKAQTFSVGTLGDNESFRVTSVKLKLFRDGADVGDVVVSIRATDVDGKPTGDDLSNGTFNGNDLTASDSGEWREVNLSSYVLSPSTKYAVVVRINGSSDIGLRYYSGDSGYGGGNVAYSSNAGVGWSAYSETDYMFEVLGTNKTYPNNPYLEIGDLDGNYEWNYSGELNFSSMSKDFSFAINSALNAEACDCDECVLNGDDCIIGFSFYSDSKAELEYSFLNISYQTGGYSWSSIGSHSDSSIFDWNVSELGEQSNIDLKCRAIDLEGSNTYSDYYAPNVSLSVGIVIPNDTHKYYVNDSSGEAVAWIGSEGNIVLQGSCFVGDCSSPGNDSFIIRNSRGDNVAYINSTGDLCLMTGDCSDESVTCNPTTDALIVRNKSTQINMSYIDYTGDLCLVGRLYENVEL